MGSHMKKSIFDEQTSRALKKWHQAVKKRHKKGLSQSGRSPSATPTTMSPRSSPSASPLHLYNYQTMTRSSSPRTSITISPPHPLYRSRTIGHSDRTHASRVSYYSDQETSDAEPDMYTTPLATENSVPSFKYHYEIESEETEHPVDIEQSTEERPRQSYDEDFTFVKSGENV